MNYMGVDIGGSSRNGIAIVDDKGQLLYSEHIPYKSKEGIGAHGRKVAGRVRELVQQYEVKGIVIERVKMHRGKRFSKLDAIVSLSKVTARIIDKVFDICKIYDIETVSWKAQVLGHRDATKEDAINYVKFMYKKEVPHDEADAVCEALYLCRNINNPSNILNELTKA